MLIKSLLFNLLLLFQGSQAQFVLPDPDPSAEVPWNIDALKASPQIFPALEISSDDPDITPLFYQGEDLRGNETRVFAWIGIPSDRSGPFPGMVLVHGANGTAFKNWVRLWMDRGYAAIALDTSGHIPVRSAENPKKWSFHEYSGPGGWGGFKSVNASPENQWSYHAVSAVIRAHSLLRSLPEVDSSRVGITGISWGGFLTCITAGVDARFRFAAPVYGCGFLGEDSVWLYNTFQSMREADVWRWLNLWDPSRYVCRAAMPMLFVTGTNDKHYYFNSWQKTGTLPQDEVFLCSKLNLPHNHSAGWSVEEVYAFADFILKDKEPLPEITGQGRDGQTFWVTFESNMPVLEVVLNYTVDDSKWPNRLWQTLPLEFDPSSGQVQTVLPQNTTACFINLTDSRGMVGSSQYEVLP